MEYFSTDAVVIGAGVVGLAIARELALNGEEVIILERENAIGTQTSSRNSEVVHAGIYYPADSLKAIHSVNGNAMLYDYCAVRGVTAKKVGKLIVATDERQEERLHKTFDAGNRNGARNLEIIGRGRIRTLEPNVRAVAAILSPSTGIVDSHGLMLAFLHDAENAGALLSLNSSVDCIDIDQQNRFKIRVSGVDCFEIHCRKLINAAGHGAPALAKTIKPLTEAYVPQSYFAKGTYFGLHGKRPFNRLIYPVPEAGGLGVHATIDLGGSVRFGPDVEWVDKYDVTPNPLRLQEFFERICDYWPGVKKEDLYPDYCGIRPKISRPPDPESDFKISSASEHGITGLVNLFGIESPGLTSALSIAKQVCIEAAKS